MYDVPILNLLRSAALEISTSLWYSYFSTLCLKKKNVYWKLNFQFKCGKIYHNHVHPNSDTNTFLLEIGRRGGLKDVKYALRPFFFFLKIEWLIYLTGIWYNLQRVVTIFFVITYFLFSRVRHDIQFSIKQFLYHRRVSSACCCVFNTIAVYRETKNRER